jgi:hypothetical protein
MKEIKIIKKGTGKNREAAPLNEKRTKRRAAREMVANVSSWVAEVHERKRNEARIAINELFASKPQTSES